MERNRKFEVLVTKRFEKELGSIQNINLRRKILNCLKELEKFPQCNLDIKKIKGENLFRIRIGNYRIFFKLFKYERKIVVSNIFHRKVAYKR